MLNLARYRLSNTTGYPVHPYFFTLPLCRPFFWNVKSMYEQKQMGLRQHHCRFIFLAYIKTGVYIMPNAIGVGGGGCNGSRKKWKRGKGKRRKLHQKHQMPL